MNIATMEMPQTKTPVENTSKTSSVSEIIKPTDVIANTSETHHTADLTPSAQEKQKRPYHRKQVEAKKLKIVVYAIAKNEGKFVNRWMASMKEADAVVVLDTGSNDDTVALLKEQGAEVKQQKFIPFRFDEARNKSIDLALELHPDADILVCTDLDEYFIAGWREKIEKAWIAACDETKKKGIDSPTTIQYEYVWNFKEDGSDGTKFWYEKIHSPSSGARWTHPVHEILSYPGKKKTLVRVSGVRLEHHADPSKSRAQYLNLLEMSVNEAPEDDRNMHYLGREYMFRGRWDDAIETLERHIKLPTAKWDAERANSMRFIARCYGEKSDELRQEIWLRRGVAECLTQRESALDLAELMFKKKDWLMLVKACEACLAVKEKKMSYITKPEAWGYRPYDLMAVGLWHLGYCEKAIQYNNEAIALAPNNERLAKNQKVMTEFVSTMKEKLNHNESTI